MRINIVDLKKQSESKPSGWYELIISSGSIYGDYLEINSNIYMKLMNDKNKITGLGDLVAIVAVPIKQLIIDYAPESISNYVKTCNCQKRKETLNRLFPL